MSLATANVFTASLRCLEGEGCRAKASRGCGPRTPRRLRAVRLEVIEMRRASSSHPAWPQPLPRFALLALRLHKTMSSGRYRALDAISAASAPSPSPLARVHSLISSPSPLSTLRSLVAGGSSRRTLALVVGAVGGLLVVFAVVHRGQAHGLVAGLSSGRGRYGAARAYGDMLARNLRNQEPQTALSEQMRDGVDFLTGMLFGGRVLVAFPLTLCAIKLTCAST